jgi:hypothetical protein
MVIVPPEGGLKFSAGLTKKIVFYSCHGYKQSRVYPKIVIESWNTHASSSSQEVLLWKDAVRGLKEKQERSQSVPLTLPASYSLFLPPPLFPTPRATSRSNEGRRMDLRTSFWLLFEHTDWIVTTGVSAH